ncbi:MAG: AsmA-like C-terminal region-containing protein [Flavobacterium sp.]|nr:AsmA-like C-terminal region-containing protein [Flavobacterium sp.]
MKITKKAIFKSIKISGFTIGGILLLMVLLPILFPDVITEKVKNFANEKINGKLSFSKANLSFFHHFPSLTLTLDDFVLQGSTPFQKDTLVASKEIALGINLKTLIFGGDVNIDKIYISNALMHVQVNEKGEANYNVYKSDSKKEQQPESETALRLEKIDIENSHLIYDDKSTKILIDAEGLDYEGNGALDKSVFDLYTTAKIASFDFTFDGEPYFQDKKVDANLITRINTTSLAFFFKQNDLKINKLPVDFRGTFDFLDNGYNMDFNIKSENSQLNDFFTALPPQYVKWLEKTKIEGTTDFLFTLKGKYIASENAKPDIAFNMKIRKGFVAHDNAPVAVSNLFLNFDVKLPQLETKKLNVKIDSVFFNVGKDYVSGILNVNGLTNPKIATKIQSKIDLQKMNRAFGIPDFDIRGKLVSNMVSKGEYNKEKKIFPVTKGSLQWQNGYLQTQYYPHPISSINVNVGIENQQGNLKDLFVKVAPASFSFEGNPFSLNGTFRNFDDISYDVKLKGALNLAKIYKVFSKKGLDLDGFIKADLAFRGKQSDATNGRYSKLNNKGTLTLRNIRMRSEVLPQPFVINNGTFAFHQDKMSFTNFTATYGQSDFRMSGFMENVINFALSKDAVLKGNFTIKSDYLKVDEFMAATEVKPATINAQQEKAIVETGVVLIPKNLNLNLNAAFEKINFEGLNINNLQGKIIVNKGQLTLDKTQFNLIGCQVGMDAVYRDETPERAFFDYKIKATDFDVKRAYNEIEMFRTTVTSAKSAQGIISLDYQISGKLNKEMQPIYPSLKGGGTLSVKQVKLKGFKMMSAVSKKTGRTSIKNPDVTKVEIKSTIKNNIITFERFKFKFAGFRPRFEGTTSFDGRLNIKMRLGLPPLGIIGIPLTITGTQEKPKVKLGRKTEDLQETEYEETPDVMPLKQ